MLSWSIIFFVIAIIAAILGFTGIAGAATEIAKILFFIFIVLFVISLIARAIRGKPPSIQQNTHKRSLTINPEKESTMKNYLQLISLIFITGFFIVACDDGTAENQGEKIDETMNNIGNDIEDACENAKEGVNADDTDC